MYQNPGLCFLEKDKALRPQLNFSETDSANKFLDEKVIERLARFIIPTALSYVTRMLSCSRQDAVELLKAEDSADETAKMRYESAQGYFRHAVAWQVSWLLEKILGDELINAYILEDVIVEGPPGVRDSIKVTILVTDNSDKARIIDFLAALDRNLLALYKDLLVERGALMQLLLESRVVSPADAGKDLAASFLIKRNHDCGEPEPHLISLKGKADRMPIFSQLRAAL